MEASLLVFRGLTSDDLELKGKVDSNRHSK